MQTEPGVEYSLPDDAREILDAFRETAPGRSALARRLRIDDDCRLEPRDWSRMREEERQGCITGLAGVFERSEPEEREVIQEELFRLLECDLSEPSHRDQDPLCGDPCDNDLLRSYLALFIGALHRDGAEAEDPAGLRDSARQRLLGRLTERRGDESDSRWLERSSTVRQWLIRVLLRAFVSEDHAKEIVPDLDGIVEDDDVVLTQLVTVVEVGRLPERVAPAEIPPEATRILVRQLDDPFRSVRTAAARGLERLGPHVHEPERAMAKLSERLAGLQREVAMTELSDGLAELEPEAGHGDPPGGPTAAPVDEFIRGLADWEVLTEEPVERRAVIKAIEAVGEADDADASSAIRLLWAEAERARGGNDEDADVAVAAVMALGRLGRCLERKCEEEGREGDARADFEELLERLTATAVVEHPMVAHAAAQALLDLLGSARHATDRLLTHALDPDEAPGPRRVAGAIRVVDGRAHAVERLDEELDRDAGDDAPSSRQDAAEDLLKSLGGEAAFEVWSRYRKEEKRIVDMMKEGKKQLEKARKHAHSAARFSDRASKVVFWAGMLILAGSVLALLARGAGADFDWEFAAGTGVAGLVTLLGATYRSPLRRIARAVDNLVRAEAAAAGFRYQLLYSRILLDQTARKGALEREELSPLLAEVRKAMDSVSPFVGSPTPPGASDPGDGGAEA